MKKFVSYAVLGLAFMLAATPVLVSADTASDLQVQIQSLRNQLESLQQQLKTLLQTGTTTPNPRGDDDQFMKPQMMGTSTCPQILRTLSVGSRGDDVKELQKMLAQDKTIYPQGAVTGYFGSSTAQAVIKFQIKNNVTSAPTGIVGELTRGFMGRRCGINMGSPTGVMMKNPETRPQMPMMGTTTPPKMWPNNY